MSVFFQRITFPVSAASALFVLLTGCSSKTPASAVPMTQTAGGMTIALTTDPMPPHSGDDTVILTVTDTATGAPIGNANLTASAAAVSPQLPGQSNSGRAQGNGVYNVPTRFSIATRYEITVHIERTGQPPTDVTFPLEVDQ